MIVISNFTLMGVHWQLGIQSIFIQIIGAYINKSSDNFGDDYLDISEFQVEVVGIIRTPEVKTGKDLFIPAKFL